MALFPSNPPPIESYVNGEYVRALDKRLDCVIVQPNAKYKGMLPDYEILSAEIIVAVDMPDGSSKRMTLTIQGRENLKTALAVWERCLIAIRPLTTEVSFYMPAPPIEAMALTTKVERNLID